MKKNNDTAFVFIVTSDSTNPEQPPEIMPGSLENNFAPIIGKIIGQWAVLEQEMEVLITALLKFRNGTLVGWQTCEFNRRWTLLQNEWILFIGSDQQLAHEMSEANKEMSIAKVVRDSFSHKRLILGIDEQGPWIRFQNKNSSFPWTKKHRHGDFQQIHRKIVLASGRLFRFTMLKYAQHFSSPSKLLLQRLPNMDYLRFPMTKTGKRPPTPSPP
jgi:hypothetical protein